MRHFKILLSVLVALLLAFSASGCVEKSKPQPANASATSFKAKRESVKETKESLDQDLIKMQSEQLNDELLEDLDPA